MIYNLRTFIDISQPQYYTHGLLDHWVDSFTTNVQPFSESISILNFTYLKCSSPIVVQLPFGMTNLGHAVTSVCPKRYSFRRQFSSKFQFRTFCYRKG